MNVQVTKSAERNTKNGPKWAIDFNVNGEKKQVWAHDKFSPTETLSKIQRGDTIEVQQKGEYFNFVKIVSSGNGSATQNGNEQIDKAGQAEYIKNKAGQYAYAYKCAKEHFQGGKIGIEVSEETLRACAATVIISLDRELRGY